MQRGMRREGRGLPAPREGARRFFYLFWNHAWKLIRLNLLFLACCIPVVTMPAALCAMDRALIVLVREGNVLLWEEFWDEFKKDFWRSLPLGLLFGGLLFLGYFLLSLGMGNFGTFLGPMFFAFGLFAIGLALGIPIIVEYFHTGLVPRFPTAMLAACFMFLCGLSLATGFILDSVAKVEKKQWELQVYKTRNSIGE